MRGPPPIPRTIASVAGRPFAVADCRLVLAERRSLRLVPLAGYAIAPFGLGVTLLGRGLAPFCRVVAC